jgi:hypothetical protein
MQVDVIPRPTTPRIPPIDVADLTDEQRKLTDSSSMLTMAATSDFIGRQGAQVLPGDDVRPPGHT